MTIYRGIPGNMDWIVMVTHPGEEPKRLDPRHELANHSPDGFAWGYSGSGPAQLALAILADCTHDDELALRHYQSFKAQYVQNWDSKSSFVIHSKEVAAWLETQ